MSQTNTRRLYAQEMEKAQTQNILDRIMLDACLDKENAHPRHEMATLSSIYRDNTERILLDNIPF